MRSSVRRTENGEKASIEAVAVFSSVEIDDMERSGAMCDAIAAFI